MPPGLVDEDVWVLHDPCRLRVIADQDHALRQPFGMTDADAAPEALRHTGFIPWRDVGPPAALVADPCTQRGCFRVDRAATHDDYCKHDTDPGLHCETSRPIL